MASTIGGLVVHYVGQSEAKMSRNVLIPVSGGTLLDYRYFTGDKAFDATIMQSLTFQTGELKDYMPRNWSASMGNDDQAFWAFAALTAAETGFTDPPAETKLDWLALAQAVFNEQTQEERRTQTGSCDGLLRWQAIFGNNGWDYINTIANTCYFNIGARLARYANNETLADFVGETYDLLVGVKYIDDDGNVYDGAHEGEDCKDINKAQFSYNAALLIQGLAHLYNMVSHPCRLNPSHDRDTLLTTYRPTGQISGRRNWMPSSRGRSSSSSQMAPQ